MDHSIIRSSFAMIALTAHLANRAPTPRMVRDAGWQAQAPLRFAADTTCCDLAAGETHDFDKLKIAVLTATLDSTHATRHGVAKLRLTEGGATKEVTAPEGTSLNWHGYHVAIATVRGAGRVLVALRVVPVASLPQCAGKTWKEGSAPWPCYQEPETQRRRNHLPPSAFSLPSDAGSAIGH